MRQKIRLVPETHCFVPSLLREPRESLFRRLNRIRPGRHEGVPLREDNIYACPWQQAQPLVPGGTRIVAWVREHTSASCSKTRTRWRRSSRYGLRVRSSHKLASCWGRNTVERHLYGSWKLTQADLARSDGKRRKCAPAHIFHRPESRPADLSCRRSLCSRALVVRPPTCAPA